MIYSVDFVEFSGKIDAKAFIKYLEDTGWTEFITSLSDKKRIYQIKNGKKIIQAIIPLMRNSTDYNIEMYRAAQSAADYKHVPVEEMILDLLNPLSDIVKINFNKNVLIEESVKLYECAKRLILATALDINSPAYNHVGRHEKTSQRFADSCHYGQTEVGTNTISVVCPFANIKEEKYEQLSIFSERDLCENSITRRVTIRLITILREIRNAIDNQNLTEYIQQKANDGNYISTNFLDALKALIQLNPSANCEIKIGWAPNFINAELDKKAVLYGSNDITAITNELNYIKRLTAGERTVIGKISKCEAEPDKLLRINGTVEIVTILSEGKKKITIAEIDAAAYEKAVIAHINGKTIQVTGKAVNGKRHLIESRIEILD